MNGWADKKLKDVVDFNYGKGLPKRDRQNGSYPVYGSSGIVDYHKASLVNGPGLIIGRKGNVGSVYWEIDDYYPIDTVYYASNTKDGSNLKYLYYLFQTLNLDKLNSDAAVPGLNRSQALNITALIPKRGYQNKVTALIEKYDYLIENNQKRIKILEELAQRLYTEWFVKFNFPGHEKVKKVDSGSEFGMIPEGWEIVAISDLYDTSSGGTPSRKNDVFYINGNIPWIKTKELNNGYIIEVEEYITEAGLNKSSAKLFKKGTVLVAMYGATMGKLGILSFNAATNQACCAFLPKSIYSNFFIFQTLNINLTRLLQLSFGAAQPNLSQTTIKNLKIVKPLEETVELYETKATVTYSEIEKLTNGNKILKDIRDLLIENLVTGKRALQSQL